MCRGAIGEWDGDTRRALKFIFKIQILSPTWHTRFGMSAIPVSQQREQVPSVRSSAISAGVPQVCLQDPGRRSVLPSLT